jgi:hypothetical protein
MIHIEYNISNMDQQILAHNRQIRKQHSKDLCAREIWCIEKVNQYLGLGGIFSHSLHHDGILVLPNGTRAEFEVTESPPTTEDNVILFESILERSGVSGDMKGHTYFMVSKALTIKINKRYDVPNKLNLIIYLNPPKGLPDENGFSSCVPSFDQEDLDFTRLRELAASSRFGSVIILLNSNCFFIKNDHLYLLT